MNVVTDFVFGWRDEGILCTIMGRGPSSVTIRSIPPNPDHSTPKPIYGNRTRASWSRRSSSSRARRTGPRWWSPPSPFSPSSASSPSPPPSRGRSGCVSLIAWWLAFQDRFTHTIPYHHRPLNPSIPPSPINTGEVQDYLPAHFRRLGRGREGPHRGHLPRHLPRQLRLPVRACFKKNLSPFICLYVFGSVFVFRGVGECVWCVCLWRVLVL